MYVSLSSSLPHPSSPLTYIDIITNHLLNLSPSTPSYLKQEHANSFIDLTHTQYHTNPYYNYIQINLEDNIAKAFLRTMYINSLRRQTPLALHGQYMLSGQNMEYLREPLGIGNRHVGYVYLVDADMKVRWAGGGLALKEEAESLRACTGVLLSRMGRGGLEASGK